jgi:phosphatidylserine decarboxylase
VIEVYDRAQGRLFEEKVYGGEWIRVAYEESGFLNRVVFLPFIQKLVSRSTGLTQDHGVSRRWIPGFIRQYGIPMDQYVTPEGGFRSFNEFFIRKFRAGQREFPLDPLQMGSPAEGRLTVFPITSLSLALTVKGKPCALADLVGSASIAQDYVGGHAFVFRLCPVDYHRFHFPDEGRAGPSTRLGRELHSVNPAAHAAVPDLFLRNERQMSLFESRSFGQLLLMEVGALCVGRIVQTYEPGKRVERGAEKGYFAFGGSTTIMLTPKEQVIPDEDLLERTRQGVESLVRLGETIARAGRV